MINLVMCSFLFCFSILFSLPLSAVINPLTHMDAILPEIEEDTLVLFDIDDTLVHPTLFVTHRQWKNFIKAQLVKLYPTDKEKQAQIYGNANIQINLKAPVSLVNVKTPELIEALQKRGVEVLAFTLRGQNRWYSHDVPGVSKLIAGQLSQLGICFDQTRLKHAFNAFPAFENGIIFADNREKGPLLIELLRSIGYRPSKVIFIDDTLDQVTSVVEALTKENIPCMGFHYAVAKEKSFDLNACAVQFKIMMEEGVLISNAEALQMASEQSDVDPSAIFLEFVKQNS